jgi:hypothetical protein
MKYWFLALCALILVPLAVASAGAKAGPVPVTLEISVSTESPAPDRPTSPGSEVPVAITFKLGRIGPSPVSGEILVRYPAYVDPTDKMVQHLPFRLSKETAVVRTKAALPKDVPDGVYIFQVEVYTDGNTVLAADVPVGMGGAKPLPLTDPKVRLADVARNTATLTWVSDKPVTSTITVTPAQPGRELVWGDEPKWSMIKPVPGAKPMVFEDKTVTAIHGFTVDGLEPGKRYLVTVSPAIGGKDSEPLAFYTAPPPGKTEFVHLKLVNIIFANVTNKPDADREGAKTTAAKEEVERVKRELQMATMFYWINSGMRFWLDNDIYVTDKYYEVDNTGYGVGFAGPDWPALKELVEAAGKKVSDYDGRSFISLEKRWDADKNKWFFPTSGGGTYGPEGEPGYGASSWKAGGQNYWLYTHEVGHQMDALYGWSMGPEYVFNHFQPWDDTAHRHGEHFDGNAWLLREWAGYYTREHQGWPMLEPKTWFRYFINRWGIVEFADDKDEDGIPDNAPQVPLDEVRWNSDPAKKDTDGDGLSDLLEAMACEWVDYGLNEIWAGRAGPIAFSVAYQPSRPQELKDKMSILRARHDGHRCDPWKPDTDGDGIPDGKDPYPIYAVNPKVAQRTPKLDGVVSDGEYAPFARMDDQAYKCDVYLAWDKDNLYVAMKSDKAPETGRIYFDFGDNGWFMGKDNYDLRIAPGGSIKVGAEWHTNADKTFGAALHNCGVPGKWPFFDATGLKDGEVKFAQSKENGYSFEIAIPKNPGNGVALTPGQKIGLLFAVGPVGGAGRPGEVGQLTLFEPHNLIAFELAK